MKRILSFLFASAVVATLQTAGIAQTAQPPFAPSQAANVSSLTISGRVQMRDGSEATHARGYFSWLGTDFQLHFLPIPVDAHGRFSRELSLSPAASPGPAAVTIFSIGEPILWNEVKLDKKSITLDLKMPSGVELTGRMVRLDGSPAANIPISVDALMPLPVPIRTPEEVNGQNSFGAFQWRQSARFLPAAAMKDLYSAKTDASGRFRLAGMPGSAQAVIRVGSGFSLAPGSAGPIRIDPEPSTDVGLLAVTQPGRIRANITNAVNGKPAANVTVVAVPTGQAFRTLTSLSSERTNPKPAVTDPSGQATIDGLLPGEYTLMVSAAQSSRRSPFAEMLEPGSINVRVNEGKAAGVKARVGALAGRVVDSAGKPAAGCTISISQQSKGNPFAAIFAGGEADPNSAVKTDQSGRFSFAEFPWDSEKVTLRAVRGNDQAEWTGRGSAAAGMGALRLRTAALVTLTGRLVDTHRKPVAKTACSLIRWQDAPRITWFASARKVTPGPDGRFRIDGVSRGEAFSILGGQPFGMTTQTEGETKSFESPRITTASQGSVQDLGDVVVHPLDGAQQIFQIYGLDSPGQLVQLSSLSPMPTDADVAGAKAALVAFQKAIQSGDVEAARKLTSRLSAGWSEDRSEFLLNASLRTASAGSIESSRALRLLPRISTAYLTSLSRVGADSFAPFNLGEGARLAESEPNWVFLLERHENQVRVAGGAHKESGVWKVIAVPDFQGQDIVLVTSGAGAAADASALDRAAVSPAADELAKAIAVGRDYLAAWRGGDDARRATLSAPFTFGHVPAAADIRKLKSARADEDVCSVSGAALPELKPMQGLTEWEASWLANYAISLTEFGGASRTAGSGRQEFAKGLKEWLHRGDLVPVEYTADGRDFIMLLIRKDGQWKVFEPAIPSSLHATAAGARSANR